MPRPTVDLQRLLAEEPFVRTLARALLADEADDLVQQTWLRAIEHHGEVDAARPWLARVVRNLAADHRRRRARRAARQQAAARSEGVPSSSELLEAEERRRALVTAVDRLPPDQRTLVLLRYYEGLPPRRIAAQLGLPVATVWQRLHAALQELRQRLDAEHDGRRRAWLLPLVPFAVQRRALPWREVLGTGPASTAWIGVVMLMSKTKFVAVLSGLLALAGAWAVWWTLAAPTSAPSSTSLPAPPALARAENGQEVPDRPQRDAVPPPAASADAAGTLLVHVRYPDEPKPAAGILVRMRRPGDDFRVGVRRGTTDAEGNVRFADLRPGPVRLGANREVAKAAEAEVRAGTVTECTLQLASGMHVTGVVVDAAGAPVGGATIDMATGATSGLDAEEVAVTAADGTFELRAAYSVCLLGARAEGLAASKLHFLFAMPGESRTVRIELRDVGGSVEGEVTANDGRPVAGAVVRVGEGKTDTLLSTDQGAPPLPAQVRTGPDGRFRAFGVPLGPQPVQVRALGLGPWRGTCEVAAGRAGVVHVTLTAGVTCQGTVRNEQHQPVADAQVTLGQTGDFLQYAARTAADGSFTLRDLPFGNCDLAAVHREQGSARITLHGAAGETLTWDCVLSNGAPLRGRILDERGTPVADAEVRCFASGQGESWYREARSDAAGSFLVNGCPPGRALHVEVKAKDHLALERDGVDPAAGPLDLVLARDLRPRATVRGRVLSADGQPIAGASVRASRRQTYELREAWVNEADGSFQFELPVGNWDLRIVCMLQPDVLLGRRTLAPGETWDLGTLRFARGGTLELRVDPGVKPDGVVYSAQDQFVSGLNLMLQPPTTPALAPGEYVLLLRTETAAATRLPFTIRAGETTHLDWKPEKGVLQRLEFVAAPGSKRARTVGFEIRRDGALLLVRSAEAGSDGCYRRDVCLPPGTYTVTTTSLDDPVTARFQVGDTAGPPVQLTLR